MNRLTRLLLCVCCVFSSAFSHSALAQAPVDAAAQATAYRNKFQELAHENKERLKRRDELNKTYQSLLGRLAENDRFLEQSMGQAAVLALGIAAAEDEVYSILSKSMPPMPEPGSGRKPTSVSLELTLAARLQVQIDLNTHILSTISIAGQLGIERRIKILNELQSTMEEFDSLNARLITQFNEYWELADIEGTRSTLELNAALEELDKADDSEEGAQFARAVTLLRMNQVKRASDILNKLVNVGPIRAVVRAAQAEVAAVRGDKKELRTAMRDAFSWGQHDARVRVHRARALWISGDDKDAGHEWQAVLKSKRYDVMARRAIALIDVSLTKPSEKQLEQATDCAKIAAQLAPEDWMSDLVLAFVERARGNQQAVVPKLEAAHDRAIDSNEVYCAKLLDSVNAGGDLRWDLKAFAAR